MKRASLALALALSGLLVGCGSSPPRPDLPPPPPAGDYRAEVGYVQAWKVSLGRLPRDVGYGFRPALAGGRLYLASADGQVGAYDAGSGEALWEVELERSLASGPTVGEGVVVLGGRDGQVVGLDAADGRLLWLSGVTGEVQAPPVIGSGLVVVRTIDGRVFGLDPSNGRRRWMYEQSQPPLILRGSSKPLLLGNALVVVGTNNGKLIGLAAGDGRLLWELTVAEPRGRSDLERMVDINADPVFYRGDIYLVGYQGRLAAVDGSSGRIRWDRELSAYAGLATDPARLYVTDASNRVWAFDRFSGASIWRQDQLRGLTLTGPAVVADYVLVGDSEGYLNWLSARDGELLRRQDVGGGFVATPVVDGDMIYLLTEKGLTALRRR